MKSQVKRVNPVAKNCRKFNKGGAHKQRKGAAKRGYRKHKESWA